MQEGRPEGEALQEAEAARRLSLPGGASQARYGGKNPSGASTPAESFS
jgi:hypothetical protein